MKLRHSSGTVERSRPAGRRPRTPPRAPPPARGSSPSAPPPSRPPMQARRRTPTLRARRPRSAGRRAAGPRLIGDNYFCRPARVVDVDQASTTKPSTTPGQQGEGGQRQSLCGVSFRGPRRRMRWRCVLPQVWSPFLGVRGVRTHGSGRRDETVRGREESTASASPGAEPKNCRDSAPAWPRARLPLPGRGQSRNASRGAEDCGTAARPS